MKPDVSMTLIIGLDFGTTFSGVAYAYSTTKSLRSIDKWPGGGNASSVKAPTLIRYDDGLTRSFHWGFELNKFPGDNIRLFKLILDKEQMESLPYNLPQDVEAQLAKIEAIGKSPFEVATDYIGAILYYSIEQIKQQAMDPRILDNCEKKIIITVPAVWSDQAKNLTSQAAMLAVKSISTDVQPPEMISEPEAAAIFALRQMRFQGLSDEDAIVICDAGGGTVDLISYEIESLEPFNVRALTKPSGEVIGSMLLNKAFEDHVRDAVGEQEFERIKEHEAYRTALRDFDLRVKREFKGPDDPNEYVSFPRACLQDNEAKGIEQNAMILSGKQLQAMFDPIVCKIKTLVDGQVQEALSRRQEQGKTAIIKAIILVGGFGASLYLKKSLESANPNVIVKQPIDAWAAIAQLSTGPTIVATRASKHYGITVSSNFNHIRDRGQPTYRDNWEETMKCSTMEWFIGMGEELSREKPISLAFYRTFAGAEKGSGTMLIITTTLFEYGGEIAPQHPPSKPFRTNCSLQTDLNQVPHEHFKNHLRPSDKEPYVSITYSLKIENTSSGLLGFSLEVAGQRYSAVEVEY